jgi:deferrochelatase/peroxidase EfeB
MPQPEVLGRNGTYVGFRKYQSRVGAFNRYLHANGGTEQEREWLAAKLVGRWRSGAPLTLAPEVDNPCSALTRGGTTISITPTILVDGRSPWDAISAV